LRARTLEPTLQVRAIVEVVSSEELAAERGGLGEPTLMDRQEKVGDVGRDPPELERFVSLHEARARALRSRRIA
jgi:hypothetical protein